MRKLIIGLFLFFLYSGISFAWMPNESYKTESEYKKYIQKQLVGLENKKKLTNDEKNLLKGYKNELNILATYHRGGYYTK